MPKPNVVDIYHGDRVTSFPRARDDGILGVIHKATTGATGKDPRYAQRRQAAKDAGLLWGAYHWGTAAPVTKQVLNFLKTAAPDERTLVALDFEDTPGNQMTLDQAREFLALVAERLGRKAVLYSGRTIKDALGNKKDAFFGAHRLWLAHYDDVPKVQRSWDRFWLWQYTDGVDGPDEKKVKGIPGNDKNELDCDFYAGTEAKLRAEWAS
jgi:GH25 family lysozyme M1 (1,4-beta-N-acetylmuramidase)